MKNVTKLTKLVLIVAVLMTASLAVPTTARADGDSGDLWSNIDPSDHSYDNMYNPPPDLMGQALMFWANWGYFIMFAS